MATAAAEGDQADDYPSGIPPDEEQELRAIAERMVERLRQEDKDDD